MTTRSRPTTLTPRPKAAITVEDWEAKAPLNDIQNRSVAAVKSACEAVPLPVKDTSRPATPSNLARNRLQLLGSSRPATPLQAGRHLHALHPKQPVQTPQQFYDWFALIDRSVAHSQESHFRAHVASVSEHLDTCDLLIERIRQVDREVDDMLEGWRGVEEGGKSLKDACERLLEERDRLLALTDEIGESLEYFQELDQATRLLNHPGESLVLQTDFLYMVERVDICIDYLKAHRYFREAEVYLLRFQQCMTRAMTLIKMYFVGSLRALSTDITKRLAEKDVSPTAQMHLLYTRFTSVSSQLAPLLGELERRAQTHPEELNALLSECHTAYFSVRKALLVGRLMEEIKGLDPSRTELVELTRAGCSYLKQLCTDEFNLFLRFFNSGEDHLYQFLENLCDYLYDDLRPRILHEPRLTALCEVCTVLQALVVLDSGSAAVDDDDDLASARSTDHLTLDLEPSQRKTGLSRLHISHLLHMVLQDAQTRLFFKAQSVIQSDIRYYAVKPEDLEYPAKLMEARSGSSSSAPLMEKQSIHQMFTLKGPSLGKRDTWFPTLQKAVWVLEQLHDFVKPAIFEDIAQEALTLCRNSLVAASQLLRVKSLLDGHLFLVRHFLILKEITNTLDIADSGNPDSAGVNISINMAGVTETLASVLGRTTSLIPQTLFASLGMPRADESIHDTKQGIDHELRRACEDVISESSASLHTPLRVWMERLGTLNDAKTPLPDWALQNAAEDVHRSFIENLHRELPLKVVKLRLYLEDSRTVAVLLQHVQDRIIEEYATFGDVVQRRYGGSFQSTLDTNSFRNILRSICVEDSGS